MKYSIVFDHLSFFWPEWPVTDRRWRRFWPLCGALFAPLFLLDNTHLF